MNKTLIEWVKNPDGTQGYTWNPITGCLNGCPYCYARKLANGRVKSVYLANQYIANELGNFVGITAKLEDPFYPRFWPKRTPVYFQGKQRGVLVCDMSDLFGIGIPESWTREALGTIQRSPNGWRFYLLTKQPQNLIKWSPFPDNCFVGVTATDLIMAYSAAYHLKQIEASVKYISFEPLLDWKSTNGKFFEGTDIDWVIIGAQTKPYKPPLKIWVDEITEACKKASIPYFLKDNLQPLLGDDLVQDMPRGVEIDH